LQIPKSLIDIGTCNFRLTGLGAGNEIYYLKKRIQELTLKLDSLGDIPTDSSELIDSANLLRKNEFLSNAYQNQKELISLYKEYSKSLEELLSQVFDIQNDLKNLLKEQTKLLSSDKTIKKRKKLTSKK